MLVIGESFVFVEKGHRILYDFTQFINSLFLKLTPMCEGRNDKLEGLNLHVQRLYPPSQSEAGTPPPLC